ncbi:MAG: hypothetical protein ABSH41_07245 [Syntrophobacteraceae bacterium]
MSKNRKQLAMTHIPGVRPLHNRWAGHLLTDFIDNPAIGDTQA